MRAVRFTKAETAYLEALLGPGSRDHDPKLDARILAKLHAAVEPAQPGVNAVAFERALIEGARGKVVPIEPSGYPRVSRQATQVQATPQAAALIGAWVASQAWLRGPLTVFTVLNKWPDWLARARATAAPDGAPEGLGAGSSNVGPGAAQARPKTAAGRRAPGIG